jgi:hypothetical protein
MLIKKVLECRLDIKDITFILCADYNQKILDTLTYMYMKKCFKSIFITSINKIIKRGEVMCKNKTLDGSCYIDVTFEVSGIVYEKGEVIHGCTVLQINNNGTIHLKAEHASIYLKNVDGMMIYKVDDEIPVIVNICRYNIYESEISVSAIPFIPIKKNRTIYSITENISDIGTINFNFKELEKLESNINYIKKNNKSVYKFFHDLIYPYKEYPIKSDKKLGGEQMEINKDNLMSLDKDNMVYLPDCYLDDNNITILNTNDTNDFNTDIPILQVEKSEFIIHVLNAYHKRLLTFHEFLTNYDTTEKIKAKSAIWNLYNLLKSS